MLASRSQRDSDCWGTPVSWASAEAETPLGLAILRTIVDLNPSVYVIIDPCCPQMLGKIRVAGFGRFRPPERTSKIAALLAVQLRRPDLNNPSEATTILTQGGSVTKYAEGNARLG